MEGRHVAPSGSARDPRRAPQAVRRPQGYRPRRRRRSRAGEILRLVLRDLLLLGLILVVFAFFHHVLPRMSAAGAASPAPVSLVSPTPPLQTPSTAPDEPAPTEDPAASPEPTPEPTPVPIPAGEVLGSGVFTSETGVALNLRALWTARVLDAERVAVTVEVYLDSYSLQITAAPKSLHVSVGESFASADTPTVNQEENVKIETLLGRTEHVLPLADGQSARFPVQVEYAFGGTYQKVDLPVLECGGSIELTR